ncbi:hypothetical protein [Marinagarivorans cellulosilyticus]|uniref:Uncharacterized protein n=1 Tax=Marinagarivorans cellulosilyticus TaxID=2721545 RepID=A0AAN2BLM1_9GAMM|nr:hypothetical protein [Marinagarivorans cellulosilyticus]BCD99151.1 hypothetical protein MARGE09_P3352 [Marinagarivorans cellulosilyticus]
MRYLSASAVQNSSSMAALGANLNDSRLLKQQLAREITSLEGQLFRLRTRNDMIDYNTLQTYEDMILSRKRMLDGLLWDED